jgi:hypothetical protein
LDVGTRNEETYGPPIVEVGPPIVEDDFKDDPDFADFATPEFELYENDKFPAAQMSDIDDVHDVDTYDQYVCAQVRVPIVN